MGWNLRNALLDRKFYELLKEDNKFWYDFVDSGNSEENVDEKLTEGFFERKNSGSKRREGERFAEIC